MISLLVTVLPWGDITVRFSTVGVIPKIFTSELVRSLVCTSMCKLIIHVNYHFIGTAISPPGPNTTTDEPTPQQVIVTIPQGDIAAVEKRSDYFVKVSQYCTPYSNAVPVR